MLEPKPRIVKMLEKRDKCYEENRSEFIALNSVCEAVTRFARKINVHVSAVPNKDVSRFLIDFIDEYVLARNACGDPPEGSVPHAQRRDFSTRISTLIVFLTMPYETRPRARNVAIN